VILDSSALVAVLLREPGWQALLGRIAADETAAVGAPTLAETGLVLTARLGRDARRLLSAFVREAGITVVPFVEEHARVAVEAYARYGKGRHPAALSFGDCLTYAVARLSGQPLLCVGDDFPRTDLPIA
jgi:ribonuclease VapC